MWCARVCPRERRPQRRVRHGRKPQAIGRRWRWTSPTARVGSAIRAASGMQPAPAIQPTPAMQPAGVAAQPVPPAVAAAEAAARQAAQQISARGRAWWGQLDPAGRRPTLIVAGVLIAIVLGSQFLNALIPAPRGTIGPGGGGVGGGGGTQPPAG